MGKQHCIPLTTVSVVQRLSSNNEVKCLFGHVAGLIPPFQELCGHLRRQIVCVDIVRHQLQRLKLAVSQSDLGSQAAQCETDDPGAGPELKHAFGLETSRLKCAPREELGQGHPAVAVSATQNNNTALWWLLVDDNPLICGRFGKLARIQWLSRQCCVSLAKHLCPDSSNRAHHLRKTRAHRPEPTPIIASNLSVCFAIRHTPHLRRGLLFSVVTLLEHVRLEGLDDTHRLQLPCLTHLMHVVGV
mmetsp:Transcript_26238/g.61184  ORF Transcript_26238/g.61184 Transcript_26238/m.61184 type:complete len:245 (+) Transcript_26238:482-1216(+)